MGYQAIISPLAFNGRGRIKQGFDLEGIEIESISMPWAPYIITDGCDPVTGLDCQIVDGFLPNYMDIVANKVFFIFFYRIDKDTLLWDLYYKLCIQGFTTVFLSAENNYLLWCFKFLNIGNLFKFLNMQ